MLPALEIYEESTEAEVDARLAGVPVVLCNQSRITRERIAASPALKIVALTATGTNNVDLETARERGVAVCNIADYCTASVVQHVFATLLALTHRLREYDRALKADSQRIELATLQAQTQMLKSQIQSYEQEIKSLQQRLDFQTNHSQTTGAALTALCFSLAGRNGATMALALGTAFAWVGSVMSLLRLTVAPLRKR